MSGAAGCGFQFRLLGKHRQWRWWVRFFLVGGVAWIIIGLSTDLLAAGVRWFPAGLWFGKASRLAWLAFAMLIVNTIPSYLALAIAAIKNKPSLERRQLRLVLIANLFTYSGIPFDGALAYGYGVIPLSWLLAGLGSVLVLRAMLVEDLLRVRAVDTTAPALVLHLAFAILLGWVSLRMLGDGVPWWLATVVLGLAFASVRITIAVIGLINRGARGTESTLDRLLNQLVQRARPLEAEPDVAKLGADVIELGIGVRTEILLAAAEDYSWTTASGERLGDDATPDPLLGGWLAEQRHAIFADELDKAPDDLRSLARGLFERHAAAAIVPVVTHDDLLALVVVPGGRRVRGRDLRFLERACERLGEALVHARMAQRAALRATLARQVELAATVQAQLLPPKGPHVLGDITVVGTWLPASRCAGDFWGTYPLGDRRVLVAIGDVTGHGIASSMVTAAAAAAVDVTVRRQGSALDLVQLMTAVDTAVRRVGRGQLAMTCFASILDPDAQEIRFVSCGSTTPYVVRPETDVDLQALVSRGNPLGGGGVAVPKVQHKPLRAGDLIVWYTDGVIEALDPVGEPFGDRRLQRMLRRLDRGNFSPLAVHDLVYAGVAAHRAGRARDDDETLVVAQWQPKEAR
jgi:serine phosphatase RsbU (regulator of sigma subunit)